MPERERRILDRQRLGGGQEDMIADAALTMAREVTA